MDKLITGHTDDPNYKFFGKLSDGTLIYKYNPPPPPDPETIKEEKEYKKEVVRKYNESVTIQPQDTSKFLSLFKQQEEKESKEETRKQEIKETRDAIDQKHNIPVQSESKTLDYFNKSEEDSVQIPVTETTTEYLDLFYQDEAEQKAEEERINKIRKHHETVIQEDNKQRAASAKKYEEFLQTLKQTELNELKTFERLVEKREILLKDEYNSILISEEKTPLFTTSKDLHLRVDKSTNNVTITNASNGEQKSFSYIGDLQSADTNEHKLILYSIVRDNKEYGIIKESYEYITHRHVVYNLKTLEIINRESYVVSKFDPTSISKDDPDVYAEGWSWNTRTLSALGEPFAIYKTPGQSTLSVDTFTAKIDGVDTAIRPTELIFECIGAGGAGLSGAFASGHGAGAGGASYARKTVSISPFQTYPIQLRINIGNGDFADEINNDTKWDNNIVRNTKDSWVCFDNYAQTDMSVITLSTIAGGGYDGNNRLYYADDSQPTGKGCGYPGKPMGSFDVGYWGSGFKPWSVMKYQLSGVTTEAVWQGTAEDGHSFTAPATNSLMYSVLHYGMSHNAATSGGPGAGTGDPNVSLRVGLSSGRTSNSSSGTLAGSGMSPGAGGGAGYGINTTQQYGSAGGDGLVQITMTKGVINREAYS